MLAGALTAVMLTSTASAHDWDWNPGKYTGKDGAHIFLRITKSAQTDLLNYNDVYSHGCDWNGISSNVSVKIAYEQTGMPAFDGEMLVMGENLDDPGFLGVTYHYNIIGQNVSSGADWSYSTIKMNTSMTMYKDSGCRNATEAARMTFIHEVGHALKLSHPYQDSRYTGHTYYGGRPYAVMNSGYPGQYNNAVSPSITDHDRSNLIAKWGA